MSEPTTPPGATDGHPGRDSVPSQVMTRGELGAALTAARTAAGLSIREVVRRVPGLSLGTASGWFSGQHVPTAASRETFGALLTVIGVHDDEVDQWHRAAARARALPGPRRGRRSAPGPGQLPQPPRPPVVEPDGTGSPYIGLRPYGPGDAPLFHGRSAETATLLARLDARRRRPLLVVGASGSGKSSLVSAGLVPEWERRGLTTVIVRPGGIGPGVVDAPDALVVDQLEELWADGVGRTERAAALEHLAARAASGLPTVCTLRSDFVTAALAEPVLREALDAEPVLLGPPSRAEITEIIVEPARSLGYVVEPALVTLLLDTVAPVGTGDDDRSLLPLLSHVLLLCWERSRRRRITVDDYYSTGGVEGALRDSAEAVYEGLDRQGRADSRALFLRLVDVRSLRTVRRRAALAELPAELRDVAGAYAAAGLLTVDDDAVTPTHEVVLSSWPRLADWIDADRDGLRILGRVRSGAAEWEDSGRSDAALPSASATAELAAWRAGRSDSAVPLGGSELDYLDAAEGFHDRLARRDRRRIRTLTALVGALAVVTVIALVTTALAFRATDTARETRDTALSRSGAVSSTSAFARDPALGRALALAAYRITPTVEARSALLTTSRADVPLRFEGARGTGRAHPLADAETFAVVAADGILRLFHLDEAAPIAQLSLETGDRHELYDLSLTPGGELLAVAGQRGVHLVDVRDPAAPDEVGHLGPDEGAFHSVAFSPDGRTLAAGVVDGRVLRWPLAPRGGVPAVTDHTARPAAPDAGTEEAKPVESLAWLPDSTTLLLGNRTVGVKSLLDAGAAGDARPGPTLGTGPNAIPLSVAVSPDGTRVAAGTTDRSIHRWSLTDDGLRAARPLPALRGWNAYVADVSYDARGRLAAAGTDEQLRVHGPDGATLVDLPASQVGTSARFLGGDRLLTHSVDGLARVWSLDRLGAASETNSIFQTASSADRTVGVLGVTAAELHHTVVDTTGTVPVETGRVIPDADTRFSGSVAMSPDGRAVYAGLADGGIQVFTAPFGPRTRAAASLPVTDGVVVATPLSPDGRTLAVCSDTSRSLGLVDVTDPRRPRLRVSVPLPDPCVVAEFSADSRQLVVPTLGPTTVVFDTTDPDRPTEAHRLTTGIGASPSAGYAHHSPLLATAGGDKVVRIWDVADPAAPRELSSFTAPAGEVYWTAFSADDARLVLTASTGQVSVVDVSDPAEPTPWAVLGSTTDPLLYQGRIATPTDGLVAVGVEGALWQWQLDVDRVVDEACSGGVQLTADEWAQYFPDTEPFDLCG